MKLLNYVVDGRRAVGVLLPRGIVNVSQATTPAPRELMDLVTAGPAVMARVRALVDQAQQVDDPARVQWLAPVLRPGKFLGVGGNFQSHIDEVAHLGITAPKFPIWFNKQTTCVNGPFDPILRPIDSEQLDYEGELGLVIGQRCRRVSVADALSVVAGYVVCNDVSVRDWQMRASTATMGKSFDTHGPFGPCLVTADEVPDPGALRIRTWVNGELRQDGSTAEMIFNCAELVSDLSQRCTLEPGDVLSIGSPAGVGGLHKPPAWLRAGDRVRVEIDGIGAIDNPVIDEPQPGP